MENKKFIYLIIDESFMLSDLSLCAESERTVDVEFFVFANHQKLLERLNLVALYCNTPNGTKWFATYLSDFGSVDGVYAKLMTNPLIRILCFDKKLLNDVKKILKK